MRITGKRRLNDRSHVSDEDVLLFADGELTPKRAAEIGQHFEMCWECRTRLTDLQNTIGEFIHLQQSRFAGTIPPVDGPLAHLKAKLNVLRLKSGSGNGFRIRNLGLMSGLAAVLSCVLLFAVQHVYRKPHVIEGAYLSEPIAKITPGEAVRLPLRQVCSDNSSGATPRVPASLRKQVFEEYGLHGARQQDFEVDYLITRDLGGAESLRNLWPEPYGNTVWNAHVKDQLETRLRDLVCSGNLDLNTAQYDLASDWIAAYKKYFKTETPVSQAQPVAVIVAVLERP